MEDIRNIKDVVSEYTVDYAMYVATSRSVPSLNDGLKPVQRRLILSANDLGIYHNKKFLKVAKLTGQCMGDYHPHGSSDPVGMAQPFTTRYPMFEGQGNFGSPDMPGSYAAERYIEIRLSEFAEQFYLESIDYADKEDNYDGRLKEVTLFYPPIPGSLLTGAQGIAIGFSTNLPSHDIKSVCKSLKSYIKNPESGSYLNLLPDTCEESVILSDKKSIRKLYETGEGSVNYKAKVHYETIDGKNALVIDAFPPGYSKSRLQTSYIMEAVENGDLELINESKENIRYVFLSKDIDILKSVEDRLTNSIGYRMYLEHRGVIRKYTLKEIYDTFIEDRKDYVVRKYTDLSKKLKAELNYLDVLVLFKQDKEYIKNMFDKTSKEVISDIMAKYNTTEDIAKSLINSSLRSLLADNSKQILDKIEGHKKTLSRYSEYVNNPIIKILEDIDNLASLMKDDKRRAIHIEDLSSLRTYTYKKAEFIVDPNKFYYVGFKDNTIIKVSGIELESNNYINDDNIIVSADYSYYILFDNKGLVGVTKELMDTGSKLKSSNLLGISGTDNLEDIEIKGGNGKVQKLGDWVLRKRTSYIQMSNEGQPDIEIRLVLSE